MVYFSGLESVIESIYLEDMLGNKVGECGVFINPTNINYLVGKIVVINSLDYSSSDILILLGNGNTVISRVVQDIEGVLFQPYILRISPTIRFNGRQVEEKVSYFDILQDHCYYDDGILYFPKLSPEHYKTLDKEGNLTGIGWALHQVGVFIDDRLNFQNLDIIKLRKLDLE